MTLPEGKAHVSTGAVSRGRGAKGRKARRRPGPLALIVLALLASGLLRLLSDGSAIAREVAAMTGETSEEVKPGACPLPPDTAQLLAAVQARQGQLDAREEKIEARLQALAEAEQRMQANTAALVAAEQKLAATLAIADKAAEEDLNRLTAVYENMKARNAARLFAAMAPEFAAGFLARMRADAAAAVLANMEPEAAYAISLIVAGRNARAPRE